MIKIHIESAASFFNYHFIFYCTVLSPKNTIAKYCCQSFCIWNIIYKNIITYIKNRITMKDIAIRKTCNSAMYKLVIATLSKDHILPTITDQTISCSYTAVDGNNTGIISIVNNAFV